jgi:GMP synthase (glutamine-hydrolysing)
MGNWGKLNVQNFSTIKKINLNHQIIILDFGSQVTQLIARNIREANVYCTIQPYHQAIEWHDGIKGVILSGSPASVNQHEAPFVDVQAIANKVPILGICYGAQLVAQQLGGLVQNSDSREYGRASLHITESACPLFKNIEANTVVWMSHGDTITKLPATATVIAKTESIPIGGFQLINLAYPIYALQFHPEVTHSAQGKQMIQNFILDVCKTATTWTPNSYVTETVAALKQQIGDSEVIMALSGGVDSTVGAMLISKAIGEKLHCIFVDNGLLRKDEFDQVLINYKTLGLHVKGVDASAIFYKELAGVSDPEAKRKIIGRLFIDVFQAEAKKYPDAKFLGQGTIYPDVIESVSVSGGPSATIKSHHNVGGLPAKMNMQLVEPLRALFKDEVRRIGKEMGIPEQFLMRHPFPGPGLGIRVLGEVTAEKVRMLQEADAIFITALKEEELYDSVWQAGTMLLPVQSVGVMGDERTYEFTCALRAVTSVDGMTADWAHLPHLFLAKVSNEIINKVRGINRVVYDISSKPPATIEWE